MTINQSGKQNENDMNSNNRYASGNNPSNGICSGIPVQTNGVAGQGSALGGGRADDSINGSSINPASDSRAGQDGDQFQYVTLHGNVIRSVIPPGKGVSVNYKVNQGFARPYGAPAPAAAPKSPTSYPPPSANQGGNNNWGQPRPVQQQQQQQQQQQHQHQHQQQANNMYATLPRSNAGHQDYEQHQYYECEGHRVEEHRAASYFEEDHEVSEANRESRNSFNWPPPRDDSHDAPTAAPLYIAPPETQHVVPKPVQQKHVSQEEEEAQERLQQEQEQEQQQMQWQSRSAPQLSGLRGMHAPDIESSSDSYTSTCTTTTTTSEEYQRMYAAQVQAYQMQGYDQSGSELDYHMDMEVAAMQQQGDQCYLSSSECLSGRRSAQECVESLAGTLSTYRLVDMVREVTPSPIPPPGPPKAPRHVEFVDEPQMEPDRKEVEPPKTDAPKKEVTKKEDPQKPPKIIEPCMRQKSIEEPKIVKEVYQVCGDEKSKEEKLVVEDRSEILESQRIFQPTPEIKIEIPPVKPIPPTNIPNPVPKEWISPMVRALTTAPDTPVHMVECPCPKPCDFACQCNQETIEKERQEQCQRKCEKARVPEPEPEPIPEPEPVFLRESPPKGSFMANVMTTAPDYTLQFTPNPNNEITLPEETEPYLPPPIDMTPYEREDRRAKSPFLKALITAPDTPYNPFGHDVCSQLLDLPTPTEKLSMVDALITAPDRPYTPLNPEKATHLIEEQKKAEKKKPYQFQVLTDDDICEQRQTSAFANMTNTSSVKPFQPSRDLLPSGTPRNSIITLEQDAAANTEYQSILRASQRNTISNVSQMSSTCASSSKSVQQYQQQQQTKTTSLSTTSSAIHSKAECNLSAQEIDEMFEEHKMPFPPPSPLSHLKSRPTQSGLHKPDTIPQYQRNWTVLPTQRPCRTPEPPELRENVPLAFVDTPPSPQPTAAPAICNMATCSNAQQQQKQQHLQQQQQSINTQQCSMKSSMTTHTAASSSATASRTMTRVSEQKQQQHQQQQQQQHHLQPVPTVPIIIEDRSGPVTMAFQSLDEHQPQDESYPPSRPYTPSQINKPAPIIPFYQTPEKLCFEECPATTGHLFDRRSVSPCPDRARSPAPGPPPNPLSAIRAPRLKDSDLPPASPRTLQVGSITTGQSYLGAQQMQQQQGQLLSHYQTASQSGSQSYMEKPEVVQQRQIGDLTIQKREKESHLAEEKKSQLESKTTSQVGNTQIERRRKVVEEYEHTQSAKTIEIRTGSSCSNTSTSASASAGASTNTDVRSSYGKTGFVANQARRLSGLEQDLTNLTSQSQAISARAATLTDTTFPQLHSPEPVSKFPIKAVLPAHDEPQRAQYVVSATPHNKMVGPPPGFKQQQLSSFAQSSVSQKQQTHYAQSSSSLAASAGASSSCSLTNASATNQQQSRASAIPVPAFKPPPTSVAAPASGGGRCPVSGKVCTGAGSGAGTNVCRAPCSQSMQSQPSSNNNTYKPTASTGPAGFKPPQAQAPQTQQKQQHLGATNIPCLNVNDSKSSSSAPPSSAGPGPSNIGGKGKTFGATSAPKRGRGIINKAVDPGVRVPLCSSCNMQIRGPFITALGRIWCPDHFMCVNANCRRPLQDVGFVEEKGDLYCEYCFEKYLAPTCSKCSGKIKGDCLNAIGRHFHPECFTCAHCGKLFGNTPFFLEEGMAYCEADWNELFTTKCFACGFPVEAGDRWVEALGNNYHSQCFNCTYCKKNLEGQSFYNKGGRPFCKNHAR